MPDGIKPSTIMLIAGGAVVFLASILDWVEFGGSKTEWFGIQWLFTLLIGGGIALGVALTTFANVSLPDNLLGFSRSQLHLSLSFSAFLILFGLQFGEGREVGILLGWIGAAVMCAGAFMEMQSESSGGSTPPTQF